VRGVSEGEETLNEIAVSVMVGYISTVLSVFINSITKNPHL